ncbi:MAG: cytochrome c3 family protein [bacterium]|nr:cytochrome c3 family protein [bacterium]
MPYEATEYLATADSVPQLTCHEDLAAEIAAEVPHPPARSGECSACHNPHVSRFRLPNGG